MQSPSFSPRTNLLVIEISAEILLCQRHFLIFQAKLGSSVTFLYFEFIHSYLRMISFFPADTKEVKEFPKALKLVMLGLGIPTQDWPAPSVIPREQGTGYENMA